MGGDKREFSAGSVILAQGDKPTGAFKILSGTVRARRETPNRVDTLGEIAPGDWFGQIELIDGHGALATYTAVDDTVLEEVSAVQFATRFETLPSLYQAAMLACVAVLLTDHDFYQQQIMTTSFNRKAPEIDGLAESIRFPTGSVIIQEGGVADALYVIQSGMVEVSRDVKGEPGVLGQLGRNCLIGVLGALDDGPRTATVRAVEDTHCQRVPADAFREGLDKLEFFKPVMLSMVGHIRNNLHIYSSTRE